MFFHRRVNLSALNVKDHGFLAILYETYQHILSAQFPGCDALEKGISFNRDHITIEGSNPFSVILVNQLLPNGIRTATQEDLNWLFKCDPSEIHISNISVDTDLVVYDIQGPNAYYAKRLLDESRLLNLARPVRFPLQGLQLLPSDSAPHGIDITLKSNTPFRPVSAPVYAMTDGFIVGFDPLGNPVVREKHIFANPMLSFAFNPSPSGLQRVTRDRFRDINTNAKLNAWSDDGRMILVGKPTTKQGRPHLAIGNAGILPEARKPKMIKIQR